MFLLQIQGPLRDRNRALPRLGSQMPWAISSPSVDVGYPCSLFVLLEMPENICKEFLHMEEMKEKKERRGGNRRGAPSEKEVSVLYRIG